jgi:hypothetical protein
VDNLSRDVQAIANGNDWAARCFGAGSALLGWFSDGSALCLPETVFGWSRKVSRKMQNLIIIRKKAVSFWLVMRIIIESGNRKYTVNMRKEQSWSIREGCEMPLQQD